MKKIFIAGLLQLFVAGAIAQKNNGFEFVEKKDKKQIDVNYKGKLLTSYCYYDSVMKPVLFPVNTVDGITVTRGYPLNPLPGERTDHPHHVGVWMNYESVNGLDFWNNSTAIEADKKQHYGTIRHTGVVAKTASKNKASLTVTADWRRPDGKVLLKEQTTYEFLVKGKEFFIDRATTLSAVDEPVLFKDIKDGFFAIRVARELEMPSKENTSYVDAHGNVTEVKKANNEGVTGMYYNSEGQTGDNVWSSKGRWAMLKGIKDTKQITIGILDHPSNPGYPAYWHARGYGLFAVNPLGRKIFSNGKEELNLSLQPKASTHFHYRILIASGEDVTKEKMNKEADEFAKAK